MSNFTTVVGQLNRGTTNEVLSEHLKAVTMAVINTGKVGEITLKLKISPNGLGGVMVVDDVKAKVPELTRGTSMFFADDKGTLLQRDPKQKEMFTEVVDKVTGEVTTVRAS